MAANGSARKQRQPATSHRRQPTSSKVYNTNVHVAVTTQEVSVRRLTLPLRTPPASAAALVPIPRLSRAHCSPLLLLPSTLLPAPPPPPPLLSPPSHPPHCCVNARDARSNCPCHPWPLHQRPRNRLLIPPPPLSPFLQPLPPLDAPVANAACVCCSSRAHPPPFPCTLQPSPSPPLYSPPRPSSPTSPSFTPIASPSLLRQCTRCTQQLPLPPVASTPAPSQSLAYSPSPPLPISAATSAA